MFKTIFRISVIAFLVTLLAACGQDQGLVDQGDNGLQNVNYRTSYDDLADNNDMRDNNGFLDNDNLTDQSPYGMRNPRGGQKSAIRHESPSDNFSGQPSQGMNQPNQGMNQPNGLYQPNTGNNKNVSPNGAGNNPSLTAQPKNTGSDVSNFVDRVIELTNEQRTKNGLPKVQADPELIKVAQLKAEDMADKGYFSHTSPTYGSPFDMMKQFGVQYQVASENIAAGQATPEKVVDAWMHSEGHRKNILDSKVTHIGVGFGKGGSYGTTWSQMFIKK